MGSRAAHGFVSEWHAARRVRHVRAHDTDRVHLSKLPTSPGAQRLQCRSPGHARAPLIHRPLTLARTRLNSALPARGCARIQARTGAGTGARARSSG